MKFDVLQVNPIGTDGPHKLVFHSLVLAANLLPWELSRC